MIAESVFQSQCHICNIYNQLFGFLSACIDCTVSIRLVYGNVCWTVEATFSLHRCA